MPESLQHKQAKERIRNIVRRKGLISINELVLPSWSPYHNRLVNYYADIFILRKDGRPIISEVDGYRGHSSSYSYTRDHSRRVQDIRSCWGDDMEFKRFTIGELEVVTDEEIEADLGI